MRAFLQLLFVHNSTWLFYATSHISTWLIYAAEKEGRADARPSPVFETFDRYRYDAMLPAWRAPPSPMSAPLPANL